ncbi:MAG: GntR family transcriptional regulator [Gemmatimonadetes bacterium]|nr:GntR family transcriptional regulator [Gemmatimonadota bacterium]
MVSDRNPATGSHFHGDRAAEVYLRLHDLIVRGRLAPGARITETEVTRRFGVSRTPVRAALQRLQHEGYVSVSRNGRRGQATVSPLTREDASELLHIIGEIEGLAGRYAARLDRRARARLIRRLRAINARLKAAARARRPNANQIFDLDQAFHQAYVEGAAGPRLGALHRTIKPQAERYIRVYVSALVDQIMTSVLEHEDIIRRIQRGDAGGAERAVQTNWRNAAARLSRVIEAVGERGLW